LIHFYKRAARLVTKKYSYTPTKTLFTQCGCEKAGYVPNKFSNKNRLVENCFCPNFIPESVTILAKSD